MNKNLHILLVAALSWTVHPAMAGVRSITVALVPTEAPAAVDSTADPLTEGTQVTTLAQLTPGSQVYLNIWVTTDWTLGLTGAGLDVLYQSEFFSTSTAQVDLNSAWGTLAYCPVTEECVGVPGMVDDVGGNHLTGMGIPSAGMWSRLATVEFDVLQTPPSCGTFSATQDGPQLFAFFGGGLADVSEITYVNWQIPGITFEDDDGDAIANCIDNCDLPNTNQGDCDDNGVGDVCEIADGGQDCNENGIPDACDISDGTSDDLNMDGFPDECAFCQEVADCADFDDNGIRDDPCVWWTCLNSQCQGIEGIPGVGTSVGYADMGGINGTCPPDGTADGNDRFHALNCFANRDTTGIPGQIYPCEDLPPAAMNVDAASLGMPCIADGVCDGNDAFAALNSFQNITTCSCSGPAPQSPGGVRVVDQTTVSLRSTADVVRPGQTFEVHVLFDGPLDDLRGYQLHMDAYGGRRGQLELVDISIRDDAAHAAAGGLFDGLPTWSAFNLSTAQVLVGLDDDGVPTLPGQYAATFTYRAGKGARGVFTIDLLHDLGDSAERTMLFPTPEGATIEITATTPAVVQVGASKSRRRTRGF